MTSKIIALGRINSSSMFETINNFQVNLYHIYNLVGDNDIEVPTDTRKKVTKNYSI